jgi:CxxC-x17-CxxC domain-containing protein
LAKLKLKYLEEVIQLMSLQEKTIKCFDCSNTFTFSVEEQEAFLAKGHTNAPKRCPACRDVRKARQIKTGNYKAVQPGFRTELKLFPAVCATCGKSTQVPFEPKAGRPVFCRDCYQASKVVR